MKQLSVKRILAMLLCLCMLLITGCQDTPDNTYDDFSTPGDGTTDTAGDDTTTTTETGDLTDGTTTDNGQADGTTKKPTTTTTKKPTTTTKPTTNQNPYLDPSVKTPTDVNLAKGKTLKADGKAVAAFTDENTTKAAFSGKNGQKATFELDLGKQCTFNEIWLYESTDNKVSDYSIYIQKDGKWVMIYKQDEISSYRICSFPAVTAQKIKMEITATRDAYTLTEMQVVNAGTRKADDFRVFSYITGWHPLTFYGVEEMPEHFGESTDFIYIGDISWDNDSNFAYGSTVSSKAEFDEKIANIQSCIKASGKDIRLWVTIGNVEGMASAMQGANKDRVLKALVDFALEHKLAGVDFDWEYPYNSANWRKYSTFLVELKKEFKKHGLLISTAQGPWGVQLTPEAIASIDYVQTMIYDLIDDTGNHASYNKAATSVQYFLDLGFKREQINMGLAFYGKKGLNPIAYGQIYAQGIDRWDNVHPGGTIHFNGCQMIRDKVVRAIYENLSGVMVWEFGQDVEESKTGLSLYDEVREVKEQYLK